jgi:hypothetical protein
MKKKRNFSTGGPGGNSGPARRSALASARAPAQLRPKAGDGAGARGDDSVSVGPTRQRERKGGGRRYGRRRGEPVVRGEGTRPPVGSVAIRRRWPGSWATGRCLSTGRGWRT